MADENIQIISGLSDRLIEKITVLDNRISHVDEKVNKIKDNDLVHIKDEIGDLRSEIAEQRIEIGVINTNTSWLMKTYWIVVTASVGSLFAAILALILNH